MPSPSSPNLFVQPTNGERQSIPRTSVDHGEHDAKAVVVLGLLAALDPKLRGEEVAEASRRVRIRPRPLESQGGDLVGKTVDDQRH